MGKLVTGYHVGPDAIRVWADIPKRRNGEHNEGALGKALLALGQVNPDAFDPVEERTTAPPVIPHDVAAAAQRDLLRWVGGTGQRYATKLDAVANGEQTVSLSVDAPSGPFDPKWIVVDEDESIPGYRCANGACLGD